ncbi:response regulator transcription factor [Gorillibacterium sp. sgz5001074]|uniref:response regulator transcription factor n=1 Tax=Gorillibacterium sp. sgz5001074 TaxID=3446695 RepID=UPI003F67D6E5
MLHIVVADDDRTIREGLRAIIESLDRGYTLDTASGDGQTALEKVLEQNPDVLITDIKMPAMNGIELLAELNRRGIKVKTIVLSGYDDFVYVKDSLKAGAMDYLLKPIHKRELLKQLETIERLKEEERNRADQLLKQLTQAEENTCLVKEKLLWDLVVRRNAYDTGCLERRAGAWNLLEVGAFIFAIVEKDAQLKPPHSEPVPIAAPIRIGHWDTLTLRREVKDLLGEHVLFSIQNNQLIVLCPLSDAGADQVRETERRLRDLTRLLKSYDESSYTVGISEPYSSCLETEGAYLNANLTVQRKFYEGEGAFYYSWEGEPFAAFEPRLIQAEVEKLHAAVEVLNPSKAKDELSTILKRMIQIRIKPEDIREVLVGLVRTLLTRYEWLSQAAEMPPKLGLQQIIEKAGTADELKVTLPDGIYELVTQAAALRMKKEDKLVTLVKTYIETNYHQPITLKQVAEVVNLTPSYLSQYFKTETGFGFMDYLLETRIKAAKKLLAEQDVKVYDAGYLVGYDNPSSFNRAFKAVTGLTPAEFRKHV